MAMTSLLAFDCATFDWVIGICDLACHRRQASTLATNLGPDLVIGVAPWAGWRLHEFHVFPDRLHLHIRSSGGCLPHSLQFVGLLLKNLFAAILISRIDYRYFPSIVTACFFVVSAFSASPFIVSSCVASLSIFFLRLFAKMALIVGLGESNSRACASERLTALSKKPAVPFLSSIPNTALNF